MDNAASLSSTLVAANYACYYRLPTTLGGAIVCMQHYCHDHIVIVIALERCQNMHHHESPACLCMKQA